MIWLEGRRLANRLANPGIGPCAVGETGVKNGRKGYSAYLKEARCLIPICWLPSRQQILIKKAVSIARPVNAKVSLITLATDPELYNQFAAPMMENLREVMQEETREFLNELARHADYPIERMTIACGELGHHIKDFCRSHRDDLVICGNHNHSLFSRATCSAKSIVGSCGVDVLLVSLEKG